MGLRVSEDSKCLNKKLLILGFEIPDLLVIFLLLSLLNLTLGPTGHRLALVWLPSFLFALILRFSKRGKPDNFLIHLVRFHLAPKNLEAFHPAKDWVSPPQLKNRRNKNA